jgi:hypothetical protein
MYIVITYNRKYVKDQKSVRESIARMSSKPLYRVQEEVTSLRQLLGVVSHGLKRNALMLDRLKKEAAQVSGYWAGCSDLLPG